MGNKKGILTREEEKFFGKLIVEEIHVEGIWKPIVMWTIPMMVRAIDNKIGDKIPEPWQTHAEQLTTLVKESIADKVISEQEQQTIIKYCSGVINQHVDIPLLTEEDESLTFITLLQFMASVIRKWAKNSETIKG